MRLWWQRLDVRERRIVLVGGVLALLLLWWAGLWIPAREARALWYQRAVAADAAYAWMQAAAALIQQQPRHSPSGDRRSLLARIDEGARAAGLGVALLRVEPLGNGRVRAQFQAVPFDALVDWLQPLRATGVQVEELSVQRAPGVGVVDAKVILAEAAAGK